MKMSCKIVQEPPKYPYYNFLPSHGITHAKCGLVKLSPKVPCQDIYTAIFVFGHRIGALYVLFERNIKDFITIKRSRMTDAITTFRNPRPKKRKFIFFLDLDCCRIFPYRAAGGFFFSLQVLLPAWLFSFLFETPALDLS